MTILTNVQSHPEFELGCRLPVQQWVELNRTSVFEDPELLRYVSPFPPPELMHNVSGLSNERDFASHGSDLFLALSSASPKHLTDYHRILDFGCGCGRLVRMFKGHPHEIYGCDVDKRHIEFVSSSLPFVNAVCSSLHPPLPYPDRQFDAIISISVFSHLNEKSQDEFLAELSRISRPGALLFLSIHGQRALDRAVTEAQIRQMISVDDHLFQVARQSFSKGQHAFILQHGHLTKLPRQTPFTRLKGLLAKDRPSDSFEYGITFIPESYVRSHWTRWFDVVSYRSGAIHDFQDIVVLKPQRHD